MAAAQSWWSANKATILANPAVDYWEGYNEPDPNAVAWISQMEVARVEILAKAGLKASIFQWSTGWPGLDPNWPPQMYPAIVAAMNHSGVLSLHEYSAPFMNSR